MVLHSVYDVLVLLSDTQSLIITRPHSDAQNKSAWKAKTVIART